MCKKKTYNIFLLIFLSLAFVGCAVNPPKGFLKPSDAILQMRNIEMRQYDTTDEIKIISSVSGVLQDLGFNLDESEAQLGLVVASKKADATDAGQIAGAVFVDLLSALAGGHSNATASVDKVQKVRACIVVRTSQDGRKVVVRATFQRIVWNASNQINRVETISDNLVYQKFYDGLSKSIFLEAQQI